jgi:hypothetical protein
MTRLYARACARLTASARGRDCAQTIKARTSRLDPAALNRAADHSLDIDVHGNTATARLSEPGGARFALVKLGARWRIDSGYTLTPATAVKIPPPRSGDICAGRWTSSTAARRGSARPT